MTKGECDCCGEYRLLRRVGPLGIETYACDACLGNEEEEEEDGGEEAPTEG